MKRGSLLVSLIRGRAHQRRRAGDHGLSGRLTWSGATGTDFWVSPKEQLVVVFMSAAPGSIRWHYRRLMNALVYQSILD